MTSFPKDRIKHSSSTQTPNLPSTLHVAPLWCMEVARASLLLNWLPPKRIDTKVRLFVHLFKVVDVMQPCIRMVSKAMERMIEKLQKLRA